MGQRLSNATSLYLEAIGEGEYVKAINAYAGQRYRQHSTPVRDGKDGFIEFFTDFVERNPIRDIEIVRAFEDGQYVFLHVLQNLNDGQFQYVTADIFDTDEECKLIEHWDIIAEMGEKTEGGNSPLDGPTEPTDLERTEPNKQLVTRFLNEVLLPGAFDLLDDFVSSDYTEHNSAIAGGVKSFRRVAAATSLRYIEVHRVIGSGNFVAVLAESEFNSKRHAVVDLYRIEQDTIVEHWDVVEEITPEATWVNSGKF